MFMHFTDTKTTRKVSGATRKTIYMHRYTAKIHLRKDIPRKDGTCPICIKIRINGAIPKPYMTDEYIRPEFWDEINRRVKLPPSLYQKQEEMNDVIKSRLERAEKIFRNARMSDKPLTMDIFFKKYTNDDLSKNFILYLTASINARKKRNEISLGTLKIENRALKRISQFKPELKFIELNRELILEWRAWLANEHEYNHNHIVLLGKKLSKYIDDAISDGIEIINPFDKLKNKYISSDPVYLEDDELKEWITLYAKNYIIGVDREVLEASIFSATNGGFRVSDWQRLGSENLHNDTLIFFPYKGRKKLTPVRVDLNDIGKEILKNRRHKNKFFDLPTDQSINIILKNLSIDTKIKKNLTTHVFRHTYATNYIAHGGKLNELSAKLGHGSIRMTEIYVHLVQRSMMGSNDIMNVYQLPNRQEG